MFDVWYSGDRWHSIHIHVLECLPLVILVNIKLKIHVSTSSFDQTFKTEYYHTDQYLQQLNKYFRLFSKIIRINQWRAPWGTTTSSQEKHLTFQFVRSFRYQMISQQIDSVLQVTGKPRRVWWCLGWWEWGQWSLIPCPPLHRAWFGCLYLWSGQIQVRGPERRYMRWWGKWRWWWDDLETFL